MKKLITIEWEIHDSRDFNGAFRTGTTKIEVNYRSYVDAINAAIRLADNLPGWEFERNNIDLEEYREGKTCCYHYVTKLSKILKIENVK